ncbi:hypothetical protein ABZ215_43660, partial [Amycolatopsis sp. NPDC006131]|uniref:hypothetical protein n=1 Tax=Amycolatopsis sp. NPDC006131 TaxID=3156731 RepID=UPI0033ABF8F2
MIICTLVITLAPTQPAAPWVLPLPGRRLVSVPGQGARAGARSGDDLGAGAGGMGGGGVLWGGVGVGWWVGLVFVRA